MSLDYFQGQKIEKASMPIEKSEAFFKQVFTKEEYDELDSYGDLFKWMMYIVREALIDSKYLGNVEKLKRTGIVMGSFGMPSLEHTYLFEKLINSTVEVGMRGFLEKNQFVHYYANNKNLKPQAFLTDTEPQIYVSKKLSIKGPILTFNAACSSPVYAIKEAIMYLKQGKADMMLAGAQCYNQMDSAINGMFNVLGMVSKPGENKPFDRSTQGVIAGSGAGIFVLKRLEDAIKDDDKILGIIESIGWSSDGTSKYILAPDADGQVKSYEDAYKDDVSPNIDYIECHATGTMAGDIVEIDSINKYFRKKGYHPLLGALKGNTGHFFTASSHAAITKVLMGMEHNMIPQTIKIKDPIDKEIILKNTPWIKKGDVKRAAVNSFGFGGTNGHIVIREFNRERELANIEENGNVFVSPKKSSLAVVGMGMHIGEITSVKEYYRYLLSNKSPITKAPKERWHEVQLNPEWIKGTGINEIPKGAYIPNFDFDYMEFKFPISEDEFFLRKDFLTLNVAKEAIDDANISPNTHPNTAVIINCSNDYSEINFISTKELEDSIVNSLKKNNIILSEDEIKTLIEVLQKNESSRQTPTAVPGMLPNTRASRISSKWGFHGPAYVIMERENGIGRAIELAKYLIEEDGIENVIIGTIELTGEMEHIYAQNLLGKGEVMRKYGIPEGAVAFVLKSLEAAKKDGNTIYSVINDIALVNSNSDVVGNLIDNLDAIINDESIGKNEIGYLELPESVDTSEKKVTKNLIYNRYSDFLESSNFVEGSVENNMGYGFSLTAAIAMVKNSLQLYNRIKFNEKDSTFSLWNNEGKNRSSLINSFNDDGSSVHFILSNCEDEDFKPKKIKTKTLVYPIVVQDYESLYEILKSLTNISLKKGMLDIYNETWDKYKSSSNPQKVLSLVASDKEVLKKEAKLALDNIDNFFVDGFKWQSFNGSYFTSSAIGKSGKIAYMFPPGGMFSKKFFENLFRFPKYQKLYRDFINSDFMLKSGIKGQALEDYIMEILSAEISVSIAKDFGINEDMLLVASMGEIASLFALNSILYEGNTYDSILSELVHVLKFMFEKDPSKENYFHNKIDSWESFYVKGSIDELSKILKDEKTVFMTIIGSPEDSVIIGEGKACKRVLDKFKGIGTAIKTATIIHTPIAKSVYEDSKADEFADKIAYKKDLPYTIYDAFTQNPIDFNKDKFSDIFRNILTRPVNFFGSLKNSYDDGARIFIDMSTNEICTHWLSNALKSDDYLALPIYSKKYSPEENYVRILAKLISNGIDFDLNKYMSNFEFDVTNKQTLVRKVHLSVQTLVDGLSNEKDSEFRENIVRKNKEPEIISVPEILKQEEIDQKIEERSPVKTSAKKKSKSRQSKKNFMSKYVSVACASSVNAYSYYVQSEQVILKNLIETMRNNSLPVQKKNSIIKDVALEIKKDEIRGKNYLWDRNEIIEMSAHSMAKILGPRYEKIDRYPIRARLPLPPFMFVSRITKIEAEYGVFNKPAMIEIEYDATDDCLFAIGNQISQVAVTESAQIGIFLIAYMGIDEISNGTLHFRIADTKVTLFSHLPKVGETFRGVYEIKAFLKQGATTLVVNTYKVYVGDRLVLTIDAIGGFFTQKDLESSKGIIERPNLDKVAEGNRTPIKFNPHRDSYDIKALTDFYNGVLEGNVHDENEGLKPIKEKARMLDRITYITDEGGKYGLGEIYAEKDIDEDHWAFKVHFVNDPVLPGSLLLEGVNQIGYFLLDTGIIGRKTNKPIEPCKNDTAKVIFRGQVRPIKSTIIYKISFKKFIDNDEMLAFYFDADIYWEGVHIVKCEDLSAGIEI